VSNGTEFTAKSVEAAIVEAEQRLGKSRDNLEINVVSQGSRGVFGLGGEPARILVRDPVAAKIVDAPLDTPPARNEPAPKPEGETEPRSSWRRPAREPRNEPVPHTADVASGVAIAARAKPRARDQAGPETTADLDKVAASAREMVSNILSKMGFEAEVSVRQGEEPVTLDVTGENLGLLIGRRGDSLAALQFMVNVMLSKEYRQWPRVVIDVQGYRARREQSLSSLGQRVAERVRRNRRPFTLEAMPANDRRIIHLSLRDRNDVETYSIGEGPARRVVIAPKR
jgi:spoIIIJ-associated protein